MPVVLHYKTKKELKESVGTRLQFSEPGFYKEYKSDGLIYGQGPSVGPFRFYAQITMIDDKIGKVK